MTCTYYRGAHHCRRRAVARTPQGHPTCGRHERQRPRTLARTISLPPRSQARFALDLLEVWHAVGGRELTFEDWVQIFYPGRGYDEATGRAWERFKASLRGLGFVDARTRLGSQGQFGIYSVVIDMPRAMSWAQRVRGERVGPPHRQRFGVNVPSADEVFSGLGSRAMSDWRSTLPLEEVPSQVLQVLADQQVALTVAQLALEVKHGNRGRVVVGAHAAKRAPCRLCSGDHSLRQHHHKIDGPRRTVYAPVKDVAGAVRRALNELVTLGFVEPRQGRTFAVTNVGYEAAIAERAVRAEQGVETSYDPERDYEAAMARRGASVGSSLRAARAQQDMSFDFGANFVGATNPSPSCPQCTGETRAFHWQELCPEHLRAFVADERRRLAFHRARRGQRKPRGFDETSHYRANSGALALIGLGNRPCGCGCNGRGACSNPYAVIGQDPAAPWGDPRAAWGSFETEAQAQAWAGQTQISDREVGRYHRVNPGSLALIGLGNGGLSGPLSTPTDNGFVGEISVANARKLARLSGQRDDFDKTIADTEKFHGVAPRRYAVYRVDDGKKGVTREFASGLGRVPKSFYLGGLGPSSTKNAADEWHHDHEKGSEPLKIKYARTGLTGEVGGAFYVDEWMEK